MASTKMSITVDRTATHSASMLDGAVIVDDHELVLEVPPGPAGIAPDFVDRPIAVSW